MIVHVSGQIHIFKWSLLELRYDHQGLFLINVNWKTNLWYNLY
jgi:hypothetical protein